MMHIAATSTPDRRRSTFDFQSAFGGMVVLSSTPGIAPHKKMEGQCPLSSVQMKKHFHLGERRLSDDTGMSSLSSLRYSLDSFEIRLLEEEELQGDHQRPSEKPEDPHKAKHQPDEAKPLENNAPKENVGISSKPSEEPTEDDIESHKPNSQATSYPKADDQKPKTQTEKDEEEESAGEGHLDESTSFPSLMAEQLQRQLDSYLKSVDLVKEVILSWEKRKAEIRQEMGQVE